MATSKRTNKISKSNAAIKAIIAATVGADWTGRKITIVEVSSNWTHTRYVDDMTTAWYVCLQSVTGEPVCAQRIEGARYGGAPVVVHAPDGIGVSAIVIYHRGFAQHDLEIYVPADAIDAQVLEVAIDAGLAHDKRGYHLALEGVSDAYRGIATALAEAECKSRAKAEARAEYA